MKKSLPIELTNMILEKEQKRDKHLALATALDAELKPLYELRTRAQGNHNSSADSGIGGNKKTGRPLLPKWSDIMRFVGSKGSASLEEMKAYSDSKGYDLSKDNIRFQADNYKRQQWFERVTPGVFRLTESGAAKCGFIGKKEAPEGASED